MNELTRAEKDELGRQLTDGITEGALHIIETLMGKGLTLEESIYHVQAAVWDAVLTKRLE